MAVAWNGTAHGASGNELSKKKKKKFILARQGAVRGQVYGRRSCAPRLWSYNEFLLTANCKLLYS